MTEFISLLIAGVVTGSIYAVTASGLVVTFNTTGIFNFAHGAAGMFLAYVYWQLWQGWHLPWALSLALVLLGCAPLVGLAVDAAVMRPLYRAATPIKLVVSLGLLLMLVGLAVTIWPPTVGYYVPEIASGKQVTISGIVISYNQLITFGIAIAVAAGLRVFYRRTRTGVTMRAVVDDPELVQLTGGAAGRISAYAWMIGTALAALAGILLAPTTMDVTQLTELVIYGYSAALVGRLRSLPWTFAGAMALGVAGSLAVGYVPAAQLTIVVQLLPMALLLIVLLVVPEGRLPLGRVARERPPRPASLAQSLGGGGLLVLATVVATLFVTGANLVTLGNVLVLSLLALSLVPLVGYSGQVSLCQWTLAGLGAVVMHVVGDGGSLLGLLAAAGVSAGAGALVALPALRLRGLYLALATLAFAVAMDTTFFVSAQVMGTGNSVSVGRPSVFGLRVTSDRAFVIALAVVLAVCLVGVGAVRRSSFGRRLVALNDSPAACATLGISPIGPRLAVFTLSGGLAGLAGALYGGLSTTVTGSQFNMLQSAALFVVLTLSGTTLLTGSVLAGFGLAIAPVIGSHVPSLSDFTYLLFGLGIIGIGRNPNAVGRLYILLGERFQRRSTSLPPPASAGTPDAMPKAVSP